MSELIDQSDPSSTQRKRVAFLTSDDDQRAVTQSDPWHAVEQAGAEPVCVPAQRASEASVEEYDALVVPDEASQAAEGALDLVQQFSAAGKPVASAGRPAWLTEAVPQESLITAEDPASFNNALLESLAHGDAGTS